MSNNNNPYDLDEEQVRDKGIDNGVVRATVLDTLPETHAVRVNPRGDNAPVVAPVLTPTYGSQTLPDVGERVMLLYVAENTPICLGSIYLLDGEQPPNDSDGDLRIGNGEEFIRFNEDGGIDSSTDLGGSYDDEAAQDAVADLITGGTNVSVTYDDANDTLTVDTSALDEEEVQDTVSTLFTGGTSVSLTYDDANNTLTINGFSGSHNDLTDVGADDHFNHATVAGTGSHTDLTNITSDDHHTRYQNSEAQNATEQYGYEYSTGSVGTTWIRVGTVSVGGGSMFLTITDTSSFRDSFDNTMMFAKVQTGNDRGEFGGFYYQVGSNSRSDGVEIVDNGYDADVYVRLGSYSRGVIHVTENKSSTVSFSETTTDPNGTELTEEFPVQSSITENGKKVQSGTWNFDSHLTNTQVDAENGVYVNIAENVNINSGFTVNSSSSIDINNSGTYRVNFNVNFHRTGSSGRNIMYAELELNGTNLDQQTRGVCYIRTDGNGDEGDATGEAILNLSAGDTLQVYANEERGAESGNDIERASINVEHLG